MGACATKPKALKEGETPEPAMEEVVVTTGGDVQVEDKAVAVDEEEKKVVFEKDISDAGGDKVEETEIVDDNKRRSLSNLFKENEKGKEPTESDDAPAEQEKPETSETKKPTEPEVPKEEPSAVKEEPPAPAPPAAEEAEPKTSETLEEKKPVQTETKTTETSGEKEPEETR
ncbi:neurofilament heavy polypeptide [Salix suchowensis]|nr:neurofilament heavy polypeptide [Salix suchowensis]